VPGPLGLDRDSPSGRLASRISPVVEAVFEGQHYVYLWGDGVHFNIRLEEDRQCILVLMGATADGRKELVAIVDGRAPTRSVGRRERTVVDRVALRCAVAWPLDRS